MATSFPTGYDALTNPTATTKMNQLSHSSQHANLNDAVEALESFIGIRCHTVKSVDTARASNATPTLDPELQMTLEANKDYLVEAILFFDMPADGIQIGVSGTVTATMKLHCQIFDDSTGALGRISALNSYISHAGGGGHGAEHRAIIRGIVRTTVAGTFGISWSQATSNVTALTMQSLSVLRCSLLG